MASAETPPATTQPQGGARQNDDVADWVGRVKEVVNTPAIITAPKQGQAWHESFFGCLNPIDLCCLTCCCPCVTFGKTHHRLRKDSNLAGFSPVNASCIGFWVSSYFCLHWVPQLLQRHDLQTRHSLDGNFPVDCLKSFCCACCDLIQQEKEAKFQAINGAGLITQQPDLKQEMQVPPTNDQPVA
ncbi:hypothetical protein PVAG01_11218 [Phlyctema vagabunda]|uniref:PLAC8 family protein n=1 Tax=Phlyctema vagabunda TaxID=108571 RepID=A0ABR4P1P1_9HELO